MYYYCKSCRAFIPPDKIVNEPSKFDHGYSFILCRQHRDHFDYMLDCNWYLQGKHYFPALAWRYCPDLDKLEELCDNCNSKFMCWTGEIY